MIYYFMISYTSLGQGEMELFDASCEGMYIGRSKKNISENQFPSLDILGLKNG